MGRTCYGSAPIWKTLNCRLQKPLSLTVTRCPPTSPTFALIMSLWKWRHFEFVWNCLWIPASLHERDCRKFPSSLHWWKLMTIQALSLEYELLALARFTSTAADERTSLQIYSPHFSTDVCNYSADLYNGSATADHMTPTGLSRFRRNRSHHRASPPRCCDCLNILVFICLFGSLIVNPGELDYSWHLRRTAWSRQRCMMGTLCVVVKS